MLDAYLVCAADGTTAWKEHAIDASWSQSHVVGLADLDRDRFPELAAFVRHTIAEPREEIGPGRQLQARPRLCGTMPACLVPR